MSGKLSSRVLWLAAIGLVLVSVASFWLIRGDTRGRQTQFPRHSIVSSTATIPPQECDFEIGDVVKREVIGAVPLGRSVYGSAFGDDRGRSITIMIIDGVVTNSDEVICLASG